MVQEEVNRRKKVAATVATAAVLIAILVTVAVVTGFFLYVLAYRAIRIADQYQSIVMQGRSIIFLDSCFTPCLIFYPLGEFIQNMD